MKKSLLIVFGFILLTVGTYAVANFYVDQNLKNTTFYTAGTVTDTSEIIDISGADRVYLAHAAIGTSSATFTTTIQGYAGKQSDGTDIWYDLIARELTGQDVTVDLRTPDSMLVKSNRIRAIVSYLASDSTAAISANSAWSYWGRQ